MSTTMIPNLTAALACVAGELDARAAESEQLRTMPADLVGELRRAGVFRAIQPRALGGLELEPQALIEMIEALAHADGSAGWISAIGAGGGAFLAWLDPDVALALFGAEADVTTATVFAPAGRLTPVEGGLALDGRWSFASGCRHAEWLLLGAMVTDGAAPRMLPGRGPDWRLALVPATSAAIVDHWDVIGLRATGSDDVVVTSATVPEAHTMASFFEPARQDGALWRLPFFTIAGLALVGVPLGIARRALDEFVALAPGRARPGAFEPITQDAETQLALARAEAVLQAARCFVVDAAGDLWDTACAGDPPSIAQRARFRLAAHRAMDAAVEAVELVHLQAGSAAVRTPHPMQRCWRDLQTVRQHAYFSSAALLAYAKDRFAITQPTFML